MNGQAVTPAGIGGAGMMLQSTVGFVSAALVVVCTNAWPPAAENVHSYDTMLPGADEVLALNVQFSVRPSLDISHVSVSVGPVTPKRAVATVGLAIVIVADIDAPPYVAVIVADVAPVPVFVEKVNIALVAPAGTTTELAMMIGPVPASVTAAPPFGAGPFSVTMPLALSPSVSDAFARVRLTSVSDAAPVTPSVDCAVAPFSAAEIVALPAVTPVTANVALVAPAAIAIDGGTVATAVLLLESATDVAVVAVVLRVTVPCVVAPAATVLVAKVIAMVELGAIGVEDCPH